MPTQERQCHYNLNFQPDGPWGATPVDMGKEPRCTNPGTHAINCGCQTEACWHSTRPVCENHYLFTAGITIGTTSALADLVLLTEDGDGTTPAAEQVLANLEHGLRECLLSPAGEDW